jgi:CheY-like chemotaxis protein
MGRSTKTHRRPRTGPDGAGAEELMSRFIHDANQCLHIIRMSAETLRLDAGEGHLDSAKAIRRSDTILAQVELLTGLIAAARPLAATPASIQADVLAGASVEDETPPRILLATGTGAASASLAEYLDQAGYAVDTAYDEPTAIGFCRSSLYSAVVAEIHADGLNGQGLVAELAEIQPGTPVVVVAGKPGPGGGAAELKLGGNIAAIVTRPFSPAKLKQVLDGVAGGGTISGNHA